jgi:geranylgeranyl diphosphate synthase type II
MYAIRDLHDWVEKAIVSLPMPEEPQGLYAPVSYMMSVGGKRIRPLLCLLSYNLFNDHIKDTILFPAVGLEIFHGFTLVHDDIMDNAFVRRGQDTVYKKWNANTAILSGDVMCIMAYQYICQANPRYQAEMLKLFGMTAAQVCEGQQLDMDYERLAVIRLEEYLRMIELKTAVLFAAAAKIGALAGGADHYESDRLYTFGHRLGMAFQIQDDLLDSYGNADTFGKKIGGDIAMNKKTFLLVNALKQVQGEQKKELDYWLNTKGNSPEEKLNAVLNIYNQLNVREQAEAAINDYYDQAAKQLDTVNIPTERKEKLYKFSTRLINREK